MTLPELRIGNLVAKVPIIQGGMGVGISLSGLASAVAREGGIGVIATAMIGMQEPDLYSNFKEANIRALRREIRKARETTDGIIGVNVMVALTNFMDMVETAIEEKIDIIFSGAGLPLDLPKYRKEGCETKLAPIVSSGKAARLITKRWHSRYGVFPDAFVVEGPMAGGHLGFRPDQVDNRRYALENLVVEVLKALEPFREEHGVQIPVIAAGGVYTGEDIKKFLDLGASGVQMATRFVATHECDADIRFKESYVKASKEDLVIIESPLGLPGRAIRNDFVDSLASGTKKPFRCAYHCISTCNCADSPYCIALALLNAKKGKLESGFAFAGKNAYRVNSIISVKELMDSLKEEYGRVS